MTMIPPRCRAPLVHVLLLAFSSSFVNQIIPGAWAQTTTQATPAPGEPGGRQDYQNCGKSTYYQSLPSDNAGNPNLVAWTKELLNQLLTETHRNELDAGDGGLALALMELDAAPGDAGRVQLVYSNKTFGATLENFNENDGWTREHLWPDTRGAVDRFAFTDIHNSRPEATRVTMIRRNMMYGSCGTVEYADVCEKPAFNGASTNTSQDGKVWMPPPNVRGDIARALMYMEIRYGPNNPLNLTLTDCPPFNGKMGILSQLIEWHQEDPVSGVEFTRNQQACQYWQGNRNPFVDFPELVAQFYGQPQQIEPGTRTYPSCLNIPTPAPTAEQNECSQLAPGDVFIYVVETDDPDGVGFLALEDIPPGLDLYMTDNPWVGYDFIGNEGVVKMTVPSAGIKAGEQFGFGFDFGANQKWIREEGIFNIGTAGDSVFLYCYLGDSTVNPLVGFSNNGAWAQPGLDIEDYGSEKSALPPQLEQVGSVLLTHLDNYRYEGPEVGEKKDLQKYMMDPYNWKGNDEGLGDQGGRGAATTHLITNNPHYLATLLVAMVAFWYANNDAQ